VARLAKRLRRREEVEDFGSFLLITYDSCRYDVLRDARTPVLDSYCEIVCAQTPANFTYAAHQAFFVGHLPNSIQPLPLYNRFVRQLLLLAQVGEDSPLRDAVTRIRSPQNLVAGLRRHGYQTVGTGAMNWFRQESLTSSFEKFRFVGRDADRQIDYLLAELDPARPFFAFVNFGETHAPFGYRGKGQPCPVEVQAHRMRWPPVAEGPVGRESPAYAHQVEAAEFLDSRLPRLLAPLPGRTVVVLCADHGDAFGEDGYWGHGVNHPTVLEVPLAVFRLDGAPIV
jgi:Sulfatase